MPNYQNGKIYIIRNTENNKVYIGATCNELSYRMAHHRYNALEGATTPLSKAFIELGIDTFYIELIEKYPCCDISELRARETYYMRIFQSLNTAYGYNKVVSASLIDKEIAKKHWQAAHPERVKEYVAKYREKHAEEIKLRRKKYDETTDCPCGGKYKRNFKSVHFRTKKHALYEKQKQEKIASEPFSEKLQEYGVLNEELNIM